MRATLVFGGTFNPIHLGHIRLYRHFADKLGVQRVLLIPSKIPPHKYPQELASGEARMQMCRLAVAEDLRAEVSAIELERGGISYTVDTLEQISKQYPQEKLYLVLGSDMLLTLESWHNPRRIVELASICALARHLGEYDALVQKSRQLFARFGGEYLVDNTEVLDISSTRLRQKIKEGAVLSGYLPPAVEEYIKRNGLYKAYEV